MVPVVVMGGLMLHGMAQKGSIIRNFVCDIDCRVLQAEQAGRVDLPGDVNIQTVLLLIQRIPGGQDFFPEMGVCGEKNQPNQEHSNDPDDADNAANDLRKVLPLHLIVGFIFQGFQLAAMQGIHIDTCGLIFLHHLVVGILKGLGLNIQTAHIYDRLHHRLLLRGLRQIGHADIAAAKADRNQQPQEDQTPDGILQSETDFALETGAQGDDDQNQDA